MTFLLFQDGKAGYPGGRMIGKGLDGCGTALLLLLILGLECTNRKSKLDGSQRGPYREPEEGTGVGPSSG